MQPLRHTSSGYSHVRSSTRRDGRYSPERLSPTPSGSSYYSSTRANDARRSMWNSSERDISPSSLYDGESHTPRHGSVHSRRSDPSPGRLQDSAPGDYSFSSRSSTRSYDDEYRSSHERYSRNVERIQFRSGSPGRSDRRSGMIHSLDRNYRRAAFDYDGFPRESQYKSPSRVDRPASQSSNSSNLTTSTDRCVPLSGRRHDSINDRRRSRSLSPPVGIQGGKKMMPFGASSDDVRRQVGYKGEGGRSSNVDSDQRLSHDKRLSQPHSVRDGVPVPREVTPNVGGSRANFRTVVDRSAAGGMLSMPNDTLVEQSAPPLASRDIISLKSPTDAGQGSYSRLNEQQQSSVSLCKTRSSASCSPGVVHLLAETKRAVEGDVDQRSAPPSVRGTAGQVSLQAALGQATDSVSKECIGTGRVLESAAAAAAAVGRRDKSFVRKGNIREVDSGENNLPVEQTGVSGASGFRSLSATPVEIAPAENSLAKQISPSSVNRWSLPAAQSGVISSFESVEEGSSRGQNITVVQGRSAQQHQLPQKQRTPTKQHSQPKQLQQLPKYESDKQVQSLQQQENHPHLSPASQVPGVKQPQHPPRKSMQSGQSLTTGHGKVLNAEFAVNTVGIQNGEPSIPEVSIGKGVVPDVRIGIQRESAFLRGAAEVNSHGGNNIVKVSDPRVGRFLSPGAQAAALECLGKGELVSPRGQAISVSDEKATLKTTQQSLSLNQQEQPKQQEQPNQQEQPKQQEQHKQQVQPKQQEQPKQQVQPKQQEQPKQQVQPKQQQQPKQQEQPKQQPPAKDFLRKQAQTPQQPRPNPQLILKTQLPHQQSPKQQAKLGEPARQLQPVEEPRKAVGNDNVISVLSCRANVKSGTGLAQVPESCLVAAASAAASFVGAPGGLLGSMPSFHEYSSATGNVALEPTGANKESSLQRSGALGGEASLSVALQVVDPRKQTNSTRLSQWSSESSGKRDGVEPVGVGNSRTENARKLAQQHEQLPHLMNLLAEQQPEQQRRLVQDQAHQSGRHPKQQYQAGKLTIRPNQPQNLSQQQQNLGQQPLRIASAVAIPHAQRPGLLPSPSLQVGGLLPLPTVQAVTAASSFGQSPSVGRMTVPAVSSGVSPRVGFQPKPKQIWQQPHRAVVVQVPTVRPVPSNRQQVSYGDLLYLSPSTAASPTGVAAVTAPARSTTVTTAAVTLRGATTAVPATAVIGDTAAAITVGSVTTATPAVAAAATAGGAVSAVIAGAVTGTAVDVAATSGDAAANGSDLAATADSARPINRTRGAPPVLNTDPAVQNPSEVVFASKAGGLFLCSSVTQPVSEAVVVDNTNTSMNANASDLASSIVLCVSPGPAEGSGVKLAADAAAEILDARKGTAAGCKGSSAEKPHSTDVQLSVGNLSSREDAVSMSSSESKAAVDKGNAATVEPRGELVISISSAGNSVSPCVELNVEDGKAQVDYRSSSKTVLAEMLLTGKEEARASDPCPLAVSGAALSLATTTVVEGTQSGKELLFVDMPVVPHVSDSEPQAVQVDPSAVATASSPSVKQINGGLSVRTAHVKPMRKLLASALHSSTEESPLTVSTDSPPGELDNAGHRGHTDCGNGVALTSSAAAESPSHLKTAGNGKETLGRKSIDNVEVLFKASLHAPSPPANSSLPGCTVRQKVEDHCRDGVRDFAASLHSKMSQPSGSANASVGLDFSDGSECREPDKSASASSKDHGGALAIVQKGGEKCSFEECPPLLNSVSEKQASTSGISRQLPPHGLVSRTKRALENDGDAKPSETPSKCRKKETVNETTGDEKVKGKGCQSSEEQTMDTAEAAVSVRLDTATNQDGTVCQEGLAKTCTFGSRVCDAVPDHDTVSGDMTAPAVFTGLFGEDLRPKSVLTGTLPGDRDASSLGNEAAPVVPEQVPIDHGDLSDLRLKELVLTHLQSFIDRGEGPFAAVKESRDAALRHYRIFREHVQKLSAELERASSRLPEPAQAVEAHHSSTEPEAAVSQRSRPRVRTVGTQIRTCQFPQSGVPPTTLAVCALCSTRFNVKNSQPSQPSTQGTKHNVETHGVVDLTIDETPVSPAKSASPAQCNEGKMSSAFGNPAVVCIPQSVGSDSTEPHSSGIAAASVSPASVSRAFSSAAVTAVGVTRTNAPTTMIAASPLQPNGAAGVRGDAAISKPHSGVPGNSLVSRPVLSTNDTSTTATNVVPGKLPSAGNSLQSTFSGIRQPASGPPGSSTVPLPQTATGKSPSKGPSSSSAIASSSVSLWKVPSTLSSSEKISCIPPACSVAPSKEGELSVQSSNNSQDAASHMPVAHLGTETASMDLGVPSTHVARMDSRPEGKILCTDLQSDKSTVGDQALHDRDCQSHQQPSEQMEVLKEVESEKKQQDLQPQCGDGRLANAVFAQRDVASKQNDEVELSAFAMASQNPTPVYRPPPLPSDPDHTQALSAHEYGRLPSPILEANWTSDGMELKWNMDVTSSSRSTIVKYELYGCQGSRDVQGTARWFKVGVVDALPLPMSCCLNRLKRNTAWHFAVRAVDSKGIVGAFSSPQTLEPCE